MYIGEVSKLTGLTIKAIRFYEEKELLPKPRRQGRYRVYTDAHIDILFLIKESKELGVTLPQLKEVLEFDGDRINWRKINDYLKIQRQNILTEIESLRNKVKKIEQCSQKITECPEVY